MIDKRFAPTTLKTLSSVGTLGIVQTKNDQHYIEIDTYNFYENRAYRWVARIFSGQDYSHKCTEICRTYDQLANFLRTAEYL